MTDARYYLYGETPVKMEVTPEGALRVLVFDETSGSFRRDTTYRSRILYDRDNLARELNQAEFNRRVMSLTHSLG
jgi:hypothetical protein